ncbi:MAG: zinc-dependent alcohol dehydrogenase family protein [Acidobacteriota bacterium]
MKAMVMTGICDLNSNSHPLEFKELPLPSPSEKEVLLRVLTCGVCHTELDEIEGRTPPPKLPVILGHQVVGRVEKMGGKVSRYKPGDRVGVAWIYSACGKCKFCRSGQENLCPEFMATGRDADGGYAGYMVVKEDFAFSIPDLFSEAEAAPLLCAGAIGYRSLRLSGLKDGEKLGLTGFGASGHLVLKMVQHKFPAAKIFVFARSPKERQFALTLGASWAGDTEEASPEKLDAVIDTTPVWKPVVEALKNLDSGGRLVINAIRKEESDKKYLLRLDYPSHLWMEKEIKSVANVARADVQEFLELAAEIPIKPEFKEYPLEKANKALLEIKKRKIRGAKVLRVS